MNNKMNYIKLMCIICATFLSVEGLSQGQIKRPIKDIPSKTKGSSKSVIDSPPQAKSNKQIKIDISAPSGYANGHAYVDLGLPSGTKWATCNLGADYSLDAGNSFTWNGDNQDKSHYVDMATTIWGDNWETPSRDQATELRLKCNWRWWQDSGIEGYIVVGPNGNSIFLPLAGNSERVKYPSSKLNAKSEKWYNKAGYWTKTMAKTYPTDSVTAWTIEFTEVEIYGVYAEMERKRCIRPVLKR